MDLSTDYSVCICYVVELATLTREDGVTKIRTLTADQVTAVIKKHEEEELKVDVEKRRTAEVKT